MTACNLLGLYDRACLRVTWALNKYAATPTKENAEIAGEAAEALKKIRNQLREKLESK